MKNLMVTKLKRFFVKDVRPFSEKRLNQFLIFSIVILALMTGYYHGLYTAERKRYLKLENLYVRVRNELGRDTTQDIIDFSYDDASQTNSN